jgi:endoglucanase
LKFPGPGDPEAAVMVRFWAVLARHLARHDPERVFLEVANEPSLENPLDWYEVETRNLAAMRENAPRHTLIAGYNLRSARNEWNGIKALTLFPVVADRNVVYNFHYYNPMTLTHQGAPWVKSAASKLQGVPYPAGPDTVGPVIAQTTDASAKKMLERYGSEQWNRERIFRELKVAADWADQHHVRVTCNEFGVYRNVAPPAARAAWTRDVRESLEKLGLGWTIWNSSFGFLQREGGELKADPGILSALGLQ